MPASIEQVIEFYILEQAAAGYLELSTNKVVKGLTEKGFTGTEIERALWRLCSNSMFWAIDKKVQPKRISISTISSW